MSKWQYYVGADGLVGHVNTETGLFRPKQSKGMRFATGWTQYTGPHGGHGWQNAITGNVAYQPEMPGDHEHGYATHEEAVTHSNMNAEPAPPESRPNLSDREKYAIGEYTTGSQYVGINEDLRNGDPPRFDKTHKHLQAAFAKAKPFNKPITVHRGLKFSSPGLLAKYIAGLQEAQKTGKIVVTPGYTSTSRGGVSPEFNGPVRMEILARKGLDASEETKHSHENEILLNHNSAFKIHSVDKVDGVWVVKAEQVLMKKEAEATGNKKPWWKFWR